MTPRRPPGDAWARRLVAVPETVFARYARLAVATGAVNLGQGFPEDPPAAVVLDAYVRAVDGGHQYPPTHGLPVLRAALAAMIGPRWGRAIDADSEVTVTVGASEGLFTAMQALLDPGDEVVLVEPCFDAYPVAVRLAGGVPVGVPMQRDGARWRLDPARLRAAIGPRTRLIVVNDPHNPTGSVLAPEEAAAVAEIARAADVLLVADEVYEHVAFVPTTPLARLAPERTLALGSAGKTFGVTGWKVGWAVGPAALVAALARYRQWTSFVVAAPLQRAVAELVAGVSAPDAVTTSAVDAHLAAQRAGLVARRDILLDGLRAAGLDPAVPDAGYFVWADVAAWGWRNDVALCDALPDAVGVVAIPGSAFRVAPDPDAPVSVRFAFCRGPASVAEGARRLASQPPPSRPAP